MEIFSTLVGVNFRPTEAREAVKQLVVNDELLLQAEPENPYDANAVKVLHPETKEHLGYLSRESNAETAAHLANQGDYACVVVSFLSALKPHLEITLYEEDLEDE